jgi:hypothetical protein
VSKNTKLDRRHDVNADEMLPQRLTRVEDMELYWNGIEKVTDNENNPEFQAQRRAEKEKAEKLLAEKKASIKAGDAVLLHWSGLQLVRAEEVSDTSVTIRGHKYGWELIQKPSEPFLKAVEAEFPGVVL